MASREDLEKRISKIEQRNKEKEIDKSWETSITRKILLMVFTYLAIGLYMNAVEIKNPWLNAVIPTVGFFLSTLTLPFFKNLWTKFIFKKY